MQPIGIVGADGEARTSLVTGLVERLSERGATALVQNASDTQEASVDGGGTPGVDAGAETAYRVTEQGWAATGEQPTVRELLETLAPTYQYVVFDGFPTADIPQVVLGEVGHEGETIEAGATVDDIDIDAAIDALADTPPFETLESLVRAAKASSDAPKAGAIATFTGRVRAKEHDEDDVTERLEFEQYDDVADDRFDGIKADLEAREGVFEAILHHRTGVIEYGEDIVFVVILAGHREEAFAAVQDGINRLKAEVPIFKKEITVDDEFWAHQ